jgi:nitroreductase
VDLFDAMRTTRAMRRLDPERPVSREDIWTIVEMATKAATGGNSQPVRWIVVEDAEKRRQLGEIYRRCWDQVGAMYRQRTAAEDALTNRMLTSADHLGAHMGEAPVIIIPASKGGDPASVFPGVQNLFLAARALGIGTRLTTAHLRREEDIKALLGIPDHVETVALIPLGYPSGTFGPTSRRPAREVTSYNRYGNRT